MSQSQGPGGEVYPCHRSPPPRTPSPSSRASRRTTAAPRAGRRTHARPRRPAAHRRGRPERRQPDPACRPRPLPDGRPVRRARDPAVADGPAHRPPQRPAGRGQQGRGGRSLDDDGPAAVRPHPRDRQPRREPRPSAALAPLPTALFHLDSATDALLLGPFVGVSIALAVVRGRLLGLDQRRGIRAVAATFVISTVARLAIAFATLSTLGTTGAIVATLVGECLALAYGVLALRPTTAASAAAPGPAPVAHRLGHGLELAGHRRPVPVHDGRPVPRPPLPRRRRIGRLRGGRHHRQDPAGPPGRCPGRRLPAARRRRSRPRAARRAAPDRHRRRRTRPPGRPRRRSVPAPGPRPAVRGLLRHPGRRRPHPRPHRRRELPRQHRHVRAAGGRLAPEPPAVGRRRPPGGRHLRLARLGARRSPSRPPGPSSSPWSSASLALRIDVRKGEPRVHHA